MQVEIPQKKSLYNQTSSGSNIEFGNMVFSNRQCVEKLLQS